MKVIITLLTLLVALLAVDVLSAQIQMPFGGTHDVSSPRDHVSEDQIIVLQDKVVLNVENARWATFTDTNSMDPVLDAGANSIELVPQSPSDINVGDIISYHYGGGLIVHRVVSINHDSKGLYYTVKGDNNLAEDPVRVRFDDVHGVLIAVIY